MKLPAFVQHVEKNDVIDRAAKTFVQAAFAQYLATVGQVGLRTLVYAAIAAGASAAWSGVISPWRKQRKADKGKV